jgi:hypothetical protein
MDQRTVKVALACLIGTSIGIITMLSIYPSIWPLGLVTGFVCGYLSYEYKRLIQAVPVAWNMASSWRPNTIWWKEYIVNILVCIGASLTPVSFIIIPHILVKNSNSIIYVTLSTLFFISIFFGIIIATFATKDGMNTHERNFLIKANPINVYLHLLPKYLVIYIWRAFVGVPTAFRVIRSFVWNLFKLIHSDIRLLCGIDSAIGALIFHISGGNVLLGILVGVLGGVLNHEILSKRVLKLVPMNNR